MRTFEYKPEWRNWQTRLTQNQVLRSVGSSPTSGTFISYPVGIYHLTLVTIVYVLPHHITGNKIYTSPVFCPLYQTIFPYTDSLCSS